MKSLIISYLLLLTMYGCTGYFTFSNGTIKKAKSADKTEAQKVKKQSGDFKQAGHISFDYFIVKDNSLNSQDSVSFKNLVTKILKARVKVNIDSVKFYRYEHHFKSEPNIKNEYVHAYGKFYFLKNNIVYYRRFDATTFPELSKDIIHIDSYTHLKF